MLHIFWIHSHITFLISKEIIEKVALHEEVLVFLSRGYSAPMMFEKDNLQIVSFPWYREQFLSDHNLLIKTDVFKTRRNVVECNALLDNYINGREFFLYVPTSWEYTIGLLLKNKLCKGYYYIEEGSLSYLANGNKLRRNFFFRIVANYIYNLPYMGVLIELPHFLGVYASSSEAFPWYQSEIKTVEISPVPNYFSNLKDLNQIVVFDHLVMSNPDLCILIDSLSDYFRANHINKFGYKFHPVSLGKPEKENVIRERFRMFDSYELPSDFVVELFLIGKSLTLYSINNNSSLLIYAKRFGSKSLIVSTSVDDEKTIVLTPF